MVTMVDVGEVQATLSERNREAMIRGFARFGLDTEAFLGELNGRVERCGMDNAAAFLCCNELYVERLPPLCALFVGAETPFGQWEVIDFLAACYPTVGESFRHIGRHFRLINPHVEFVVSDGAAGELPFVEFRHQLSERDEFFDEYTTGIFLAHFRAMSRCPLRLAALHSVRARPVDADWRAQLERYLGCVPTYEARHGRMVFVRSDWEAPLVGANPRLRAALEAHAHELHREEARARGFGERVRAVVSQVLRDGEPRIAEVAQRLGMTARTLQRRLQDEALGFTTLVDEARLEMARRYLADPLLSIAEVSFALGYSEPSAFTRAFKRWSGCAPAEYRESARASQSQ
jgi:AraC-like DNA-binding protein